MARRGKGYRRGPYQFTARRRYALKKAQEASAKKRKSQRNKRIGVAAGAIAGIAVAGYLGNRYGSSAIKSSVKHKRIQAANDMRRSLAGRKALAAVQPGNKEATRVGNAVSVAPPSQTHTTQIGWYQRAQADKERAKLNRARPAPAHMRGATDRQTERSVRKTLKEARKTTTGNKTASLTGTPGGTKTPMKAIPHRPETWKDEDWADALAFDTPTRQPLSGTPQRGSSGSGRKTAMPQPRDPLHTLAKMRYDDSKLLGTPIRSGDTDAFLASAGTSRSAPKKRTIKRR